MTPASLIYRVATAFTIFSLLPSAASSAEEVVISAEELQRMNAEVIRVERLTTTARSPRVSIADLAIDRRRISEATTAVDPGTNAVDANREWRIQPGEYVALKVEGGGRDLACTMDTGQCSQTEFRYLAFDRSGSRLDLSLDVEADSNLRYVSSERHYEGSLFVKLTDQANPGTVGDIDGAIQVVINAPVDTVTPDEILDIAQTNRYQAIELSVRDPEDPTVVRLAPSTESSDPYVLDLGVTRPALVISAPSSILGFGLEAATITVRLDGVDEFPTTAIVLEASGGLGSHTLVFDGSGTATTTLRSRSFGSDTITASLNPFASGTRPIEYTLPWSWVISVLVGSCIGIAIRFTMRRRHPELPGDRKYDVAIGLLGGLMTAILYALGVNILGIPLPGGYSETLTLALSALGGWVFPTWLAKLGRENPKQENP